MEDVERPWERLVLSAAQLGQAELPAETVEQVCRILADTLGVIAAGTRQDEMRRYLAADTRLFPHEHDGPATIFAPEPVRGAAEHVAFVNATAGTFLELDEGCRPTGHPAIHVVPPALAVAEVLHASGDALVRAVAAGYEVAARLFEAYRLRHPVHPHGHLGAVGGAVAVALLVDTNPLPAARVAATFPLLSLWDACYEGATARNAYTGVAAATALRAHRLATAGFRGSRIALDRAFGELVGECVAPECLTSGVAPDRLRVHRNYFKVYSACALAHTALEAALVLRPQDPADVVGVDVETVTNNLKIAYPAVANELSTRFSLSYAVAAVLVHGHGGPSAFTYDPAVAALAERVRVQATADLDARWPEAAPARVTVHTSRESLTHTVDNPPGHHANPVDTTQLHDKFVALVERPDAASCYERLMTLPAADDVAKLLRAAW